MDSVPAERAVTPLPAIPRVIGTLNLVFGSFLFLLGWTCLGETVGPSFLHNRPVRLEAGDTQHLYNQVHKELLAALERREAATQDRGEKERLRGERLALARDHRDDIEATIDLGAVNRGLLWTTWYFWADLVTGPILNVLLLASGIGLTQMKEWARRLALWVSALKLVRLVALTALLMVVVIPQSGAALDKIIGTKLGEVVIAKLNSDHVVQYDGKSPAPPMTPQNFVPGIIVSEYLLAITILLFGSVYPVVSIVLLSRRGARAACLLSEETEPE